MILSTTVLALSLLAVSASGSAIKGRSEEYSSKGGRQLVGPAAVGHQLRPYNYEQQQHQEASYAAKGQEVHRTDEASPQASPVEQARLATDSEHAYQAQQREETKSERQQFYEAQPQLRTEEQTRLVNYAEQTRLDDSSVQQRQQVAAEANKYEAPKYEARPQVREEAQSVSVVAAAAVPVGAAAAKGAVYSKTTEERRDEQVQYASAAGPQPEQRKLVEEVQRVEESKGQRGAYGEDSAKASQVSKAAEAATVQRIEEQKFEQQEQQQAVELTKQEHYEQRRFEEQTEQRSDEQVVQVREEAAAAAAGGLKGGLRAAGAEAEPYAFDYSVEGSSRRETGDQYGVVRGQYTIQNPDGSQRVVDYVADRDGFRAQVQSNEFGSEAQQAAQQAAQRASQQPQQASGDFARLDTKTVVYAPAPVPVAPVVAAAAPAAPVAVAAPAVAIKSVPQPIVQVVAAAPAPAVVPEVIRAKAASAESTSYQDEGQQRVYIAQEALVQQAPAAYKGRQAPSVSVNTDSGYRSPKSAFRSAELVRAAAPEEPLLERASSFESATAHRQVVHSHAAPVPAPAAVVRHVVPGSSVVPVVRHHLPAVPVAPGRRDRHPHPQHQHYRQHHSHQQPSSVVPVSVSRAQLQHDRYPPTLRRHDHLAAVNPRVSFYANNNNNNFDDEQPAGFEHPAEPIL